MIERKVQETYRIYASTPHKYRSQIHKRNVRNHETGGTQKLASIQVVSNGHIVLDKNNKRKKKKFPRNDNSIFE